MVSLHVIQGPDKGLTFTVPDREATIGRETRDTEITDRTVSREHARLFPTDGTWSISDLGSANGTYVNGVRLSNRPTTIKRGDQIRCGGTLLVFGGSTATAGGTVQMDSNGQLVDAAIVASVPSNEDSVIIPTPEAGAQAIGSLRILYDLIAEVGSIFNVDQLLVRVLDKVFDVLHADRGYVMLIGADGEPALKASRVAEELAHAEVPISRTIINEVVSKQVGLLSSNAMSDKRFASGKSVHDFGIRSAICVPIKGRESILGIIHVDCSVSNHTYSTEQLRLLTAIGYQTGLAIENVRLHESTVQAERLAAVGETVAYLSHNIKNILQALSAGTDVVKMGLDRGDLDRASKGWPIVERNLARINDLILNMLTFSKDRQPVVENINVNKVLGECIELITPSADERSVALLTDFDEMPPIPADSSGLHQALMNLISNALDAVEDQTGAVTVTTSYDSMNRRVVITVVDNGKGIPDDQMEHIFHPFWSSKGQKGTGLGLAVAKKIIEEHNGRIDATSRPNEGTTFRLVLPAVESGSAADTHGPGAKEDTHGPADKPAGNQPKRKPAKEQQTA